MGAQYAAFIIQFVVSVLISRLFLAPAEVGMFSVALAAAMVISLLQDFGVTRYVSGRPAMGVEEARACATVSLVMSWLIALAVLLAAWPVSRLYAEPGLIPLLCIIAASYLLYPFSTVSAALLVRDMDYRSLFVVNVGSAVAGGAVSLATAASGFSASSLAWGMIAQALAKAMIAQTFRPLLPRWPVSRDEAQPILGFGSASLLLTVSATLGMRTPDLIVGRIISLEAVGLYSRATALAGQLSVLVTGAINGVFYPAFARLRDQGAELGAPYLRVVAGNTAINWAAMAGLAVAAEPLVLMLYGERWSGAAPLLFWTALAEMCFVAIPMHVDMPILLGRIKTLIIYNIFDTLAAITLLIVAAQHSLEWAAIARLGYGLAWILIYIRFQHSLIHFNWGSLISIYLRSGLTAFAAVSPMLLAFRFWQPAIETNFGQLLLLTAAGVVTWLFAMFALRHPARDDIAALLGELLSSVRTRIKRV